MVKTVKIAFYKGKGNWLDRLIRLVTRSKYSHLEFIYEGISYSSSSRDGGVRSKKINFKESNWDIYSFKSNDTLINSAIIWAKTQEGRPYDYWGAVGTVIKFIKGAKNKWFCSEFIAQMMRLSNVYPHPSRLDRFVTPEKIYEFVKRSRSFEHEKF
jgi:uncharacterized protein YycO